MIYAVRGDDGEYFRQDVLDHQLREYHRKGLNQWILNVTYDGKVILTGDVLSVDLYANPSDVRKAADCLFGEWSGRTEVLAVPPSPTEQ